VATFEVSTNGGENAGLIRTASAHTYALRSHFPFEGKIFLGRCLAEYAEFFPEGLLTSHTHNLTASA